MLTYPQFDPVALQIGPLKIHWYGVMYLLGFFVTWILANRRAKRLDISLTSEQIADLIFYGALGVIVGGRLGYMLFYGWSDLIANPLNLFKIWQGGMAFHGGLLGVLVSLWLYSRKIKKSFFELTDFIAPMVPIGLGAGRIGNFINSELWGRVSTAPWAMVFPDAGPLPRHPSQLYEFFFEGIVLFIVLWWFSSKPRPRMAVSALFLIGYGCIRFVLEFFRQPDMQIGFVAFGWMTKGQLLSIPMIVVGIMIMCYVYTCSGET